MRTPCIQLCCTPTAVVEIVYIRKLADLGGNSGSGRTCKNRSGKRVKRVHGGDFAQRRFLVMNSRLFRFRFPAARVWTEKYRNRFRIASFKIISEKQSVRLHPLLFKTASTENWPTKIILLYDKTIKHNTWCVNFLILCTYIKYSRSPRKIKNTTINCLRLKNIMINLQDKSFCGIKNFLHELG